MKHVTLATAKTLETMTKFINSFYYSTSYIIKEDLTIYSTILNRSPSDTLVVKYKNGYKFIRVVKEG